MIDIKILRENPDLARKAIADKRNDCDLDAVLELDSLWRVGLTEVEQLRARQKTANKEMAALPKGTPEFMEKVKEMKAVAQELKNREGELRATEEARHQALLSIPNMPHSSVPVAPDPSGNVVHSTWGDPEEVSGRAMAHYDLPWLDQIIDFPRGVKVTGAGFPFYIGEGARLVRALIQFFLEEATASGYREIAPPLLVNAESATATGQLPDKEGQMYETMDRLFAIPTAEVPVTNFYRDGIFSESELPVKICAYSPCFRREAGSHGKEVRGLNRMHQFDKVELVKWTHPSSSYDELESLLEDASRLLRKLELPHRVLLMCTGDLGFTPAKKYDLEVWAGGQKRWLEVSSCSNFEAFQARRASIRFRDKEGRVEPVHTLNGSGLAVPRVLAAILENNQEPDGRIRIPGALLKWFGREFLSPGAQP